MTLEEALALAMAALAPLIPKLTANHIFRGAWNKQSYLKIAGELNQALQN